ncbi:hypothetical protein FisN_24Lh086 [Fistulifera solaris]|uniref:rRNA maturation factor n=1 Tax=Fistulifera solaris TaxID=1519565 RepID=A0A1Z5K9I9_FISSO|nr:hypothetical protein FisN_24Lh086 [Fistulifera solaris]|eukprot:GAX22805.1 hypothetical protein FisN_24Lh086 [Fistulifera solaris]
MNKALFMLNKLFLSALFRTSTGYTVHSCIHRGRTQIRCYGSKPGSSTPGKILFQNDLSDVLQIDEARLLETLSRIRRHIGYETYGVSLELIGDEEMQAVNLESRGVDAPSDILSFPFSDYIEPGTLEPPQFDIPDYYQLGDLLVDVPYVMRRCQEDKEYYEQLDESDDEEEEDERGVSGAMARIYDAEERIHMLLVHGMLHLVGYDHEDDDDYELMVAKEEEILAELGMFPKHSP